MVEWVSSWINNWHNPLLLRIFLRRNWSSSLWFNLYLSRFNFIFIQPQGFALVALCGISLIIWPIVMLFLLITSIVCLFLNRLTFLTNPNIIPLHPSFLHSFFGRTELWSYGFIFVIIFCIFWAGSS